VTSFESVAASWWQAAGSPSCSIAVLRHGSPLYIAGFGDGAAETIYQTASLGKHFTAALALLLARSGDGPSLDAPIISFLPELQEIWKDLTLRHLLSHTGGVPDSGYHSLNLERDYSDSEIVEAIAGSEPDFPLGAAWKYSNAGYVLAGIAIGRAMGAFYGDLLRERIFEPLGMNTASANTSQAPIGLVRSDDGNWVRAAYVSPTLNRVADGGLSMSVLDFVKWESALSSAWGVAVASMFDETTLVDGERCGYGLGWVLTRSNDGRIAEHDGSWQGFSTAMVRHIEQGTSAVVLANRDGCDATALARALVQPS